MLIMLTVFGFFCFLELFVAYVTENKEFNNMAAICFLIFVSIFLRWL